MHQKQQNIRWLIVAECELEAAMLDVCESSNMTGHSDGH